MRVFAPGKAVVIGEYAVLDGAPALVAAVPFGVVCEVAAASERIVVTPGDDRFVSAALHAVDAPPARYVFADAVALSLPYKPGLGGSAAATVAAVRAGRLVAGLDASNEVVWPMANAVHHAVQGSGSGIDVAASTFGGFVRFVRGAVPAPVPAVAVDLVATDRAASTGPRVAQYLASAGREAFVAESAALVDGFADDPIGALRAAHALLASMTRAAGIDWETPAHAAVTALAVSCGGAAKPSGAGGGDVAVAILPDDDARAAFDRGLAAIGLVRLVPPSAPG
jgi:phosphomevalonate kinase